MATRMLQRRGTAAEWAAANPVLGAGEVGFETDTKILKLGDGVTAWNALTSPFEPYLLKTGKAADSDKLDGLDSTAFMRTTATKTVRIPHTWTITGDVKVASGDVSVIPPMFAPYIQGTQTCKLISVHFRLITGTSVTFKMQRGTFGGAFADISGWTGIGAAGATDGGSAPNTVTLSSGTAPDKIVPVVTAVSGTPKNLTITATLEYTF